MATNNAINDIARPMFLANKSSSSSNVTGDGTAYTVIFDNALSNVGSNYNTSTGVFTATRAGYYTFEATVSCAGIALQNDINLTLHSSSDYILTESNAMALSIGGALAIQGSLGPLFLNVNDTVSMIITCSGSTKTVGVVGSGSPYVTFFSGYLIS